MNVEEWQTRLEQTFGSGGIMWRRLAGLIRQE